MAKKNTVTVDTLLNVDGKEITVKAWLKSYAKDNGFKSFETSGGKISANDFALLLLDYAISGKELDEELSDFAEHVATIAAIIEEGKVVPKSTAEIKAERDAEKAVADQKAADEKAATEAAKLAVVESFAGSMSKGAESTKKVAVGFLDGIRKSFPSTIQVDAGGKVEISADASAEDVGVAFGAAIQFNQTAEVTGNMLGFIIGELTNAAVAKGIYATKKDCAADISARLEASKIKSLSVKSIENLARVAERIPADKRNDEAAPTIYHLVANVKQPKAKDGESDAKFKTRKEKYATQIDAILDKVKTGEISEVKQVKEAIDNLQKKSGLKGEATYTAGDYAKIYVEAQMMVGFCGKDGTLFLAQGGADGDSVEMTREDFREIAKSALAHLTNIKGIDPKADMYLSQLLIGFKSVALTPAAE